MTELFFVDLKKSDFTNYDEENFNENFPESLAEKIKKTKNEKLRKDRIAVYTVLIDILSKKEEKKKVFSNFAFTEKGKPYLKNSDVYFSVSHTDGLGVIAISNTAVGVDVEKIIEEKRETVEKICDKFNLPKHDFEVDTIKNVNYCLVYPEKNETNQILTENINANEVRFSFFRWTNFEARLKLNGNGFSEIQKTLNGNAFVKSYLFSIEDSDFAVSVAG